MQKSESITNLAKAMAAFQAEIKNPANTATNPHFKSKYAPLNDILNDVRPILSKHGLSVFQSPGGDGDKISITTLVTHSSGEWIESDPCVVKADKPTAQGAGSGITYARRYSLSAMLGISSEDDDDGNGAEPKPKGKGRATNQQPPSPNPTPTPNPTPSPAHNSQPSGKATQPQLSKMYAMVGQAGMKTDEVKAWIKEKYNCDSSSQLTIQQASNFIEYLGTLIG